MVSTESSVVADRQLVSFDAPAPAAPRCLVCGRAGLEVFLDLGSTPLANAFRLPGEVGEDPSYPLRIARCPHCQHVQLAGSVPPEKMFNEYLYVSSYSETLVAHLDSLAAAITARRHLGKNDLAVDIGSNDGTLLSAFARRGVRTTGIEPARNLATLARSRGIETECCYFDRFAARKIRQAYGPAMAVTATNSFPHIQDLDEYLRALDLLLDPRGVFVVEAHYLGDMLGQTAFDTIYHEHVSYWSLGPMKDLFERHGLTIFDVERLPIHHGQLRVWAARAGAVPVQDSVERLLAAEREAGYASHLPFDRFAERAAKIRASLGRLLSDLRSSGATIAGYGAPAKATTLVSYLGLGPETIRYVADRSPLKQGRLVPGARIPIVSPERLLADRPDYVLILAWNFVDEIVAQLDAYRRAGGRFLVPVPEARILD